MEIGSIIVSFIVGIIVSFTFYRLQKKDAKSAEKERNYRAKDEVISLIERYFINDQPLTESSILNHIQACERTHQANISEFCTPYSILQDVVFRIQKSPHLNNEKRTEQVKIIENMIESIDESNSDDKSDINLTIHQLSDLIGEHPEKKDIDNNIKLIHKKFKQISKLTIKENKLEKWIKRSSIFAGIGIAIASRSSYQYYENLQRQYMIKEVAVLNLEYKKDLLEKQKALEEYREQINESNMIIKKNNDRLKSALKELSITKEQMLNLEDINVDLKSSLKALDKQKNMKEAELNSLSEKLMQLQVQMDKTKNLIKEK